MTSHSLTECVVSSLVSTLETCCVLAAGVEMEALTAATVAGLTVYDMCKAASKDIVIDQVRLDMKSGGRSGTYMR